MVGSWAGAMGQTQFMPSSFVAYAVDHDGDGRKDIWNSRADALASGANYLARQGWKGDQTWGRAVTLPDGFDSGLADLKVRKPLSAWQRMGVRRTDGADLPRRELTASVVQPEGAGRPGFRRLQQLPDDNEMESIHVFRPRRRLPCRSVERQINYGYSTT